MATPIHCFRTTPIMASYDRVKPDPARQKAVGSNATLFGWKSDPEQGEKPDPIQDTGRVRPKIRPVCFTEEKAKELRKKTIETSSFHDIMYHSAIASRLASDVSQGRMDR